MVRPIQKNYDLSTPKGKAEYTIDMLEYRDYLKIKKSERDANCAIADGMRMNFRRMNDPKRMWGTW